MAALEGRPSIRGLSIIAAIVLGVLVLGMSASLIWAAAQLDRATDVVERDMRGMAAAITLERDLHSYNRLSNILAARKRAPDLTAANPDLEREMHELTATNTALEDEMNRLLAQASQHVGSAREAALVAQAARALDEYVRARKALESQHLDEPDLIHRGSLLIQPSLSAIIALRELNEREVQRSQAEAARMEEVARLTGIVGPLLFLIGLAVVVLGVRAYAVRPILDLHGALERLRCGDSKVRLKDSRAREMTEVARAFNEMIDTLERQRTMQLAFLAGVAHDLRNPLAAIKMGIHALEQGLSEERQARALAMLDRQLDRLARMVNDLLDTARIEAGELELRLEEIDLGAAAREIIRLYEPTSPGHTLALEVPDEAVVVRGDPLRIEQVISNLLSNAIKFSPQGGRVDVKIRVVGGEAVLSVADQGIGIAAEKIAEIFLPFRRQASKVAPGAGLGLSVVRHIVVAHGGSIEVESTPGAGSTFHVRLPPAPRLAAEPAPYPEPPAA